jgi:hypothetical protein
MSKHTFVKHLSNMELLERMAEDLIAMHNETGIDLGYWETAREIVERFYYIDIQVKIERKRVVASE